jgi:hypothetical protein
VTRERLSNRQIATLKRLAVCCARGGLVTLTRPEREAMQPLWRRGVVEMWFRCVPDEGSTRIPFFRPTDAGWRLIEAIFRYRRPEEQISGSAA